MKVFGPEPWGPALDDPQIYVGRLAIDGEMCKSCGEVVLTSEAGVILTWQTRFGPERVVEHRECYLYNVFGSVGHQRGLCSCFGGPGSMEDPPGLTKREAACAAVDEWHARHGGRELETLH